MIAGLRLLVLLALAITCPLGARAEVAPLGRPADYGSFRSVSAYASLAEALAAESHLYLPPGTYVVDNPLVVDRQEPLFLHGAGRRATRLVARKPAMPLLLVKRASLLNLSNLLLAPAERLSTTESRALLVTSEEPVVIELQDCHVQEAVLEFRGPGSFRLQGTSLLPVGAVRSPLIIDHPGASFTMVGGNISNMKSPPRFASDEAYHLWQRRGRVRVYGTGVQATLGRADFRIDTAAGSGPHVVANVRSEGNNGANKGSYRSTLVEVSRSREPVDLVIVSSTGAWASQGRGRGRLVHYNAAGTLWLLGNNAATSASALAEGEAPGARVFALGNVSFGKGNPLPIRAGEKIAVGNLSYRGRSPSHPLRAVFPHRDLGEPAAARALSAPPPIDPPPPIPRPRLEAPLPGMRSVREFGAVGDGRHDDTKSLQAAFDANCADPSGKILFFPAGTYRVTDRILFNHRKARCQQHPSGGWIAGAGSDRTVISRDGAKPGGTFASEGIAQMTIQGLTFRATPFDPSDASRVEEAAFALENVPGVGHASQGVTFYDVVFDGGRQALGIGLESEYNCSENLMVDSEFRNARIGLAVGSYNALANLVYRGSFVGNEVAAGHDEQALSGGTWAFLGARVRGARRSDFALRNSASGVWYFSGLDSDSPAIIQVGTTGAIFPLVFEDSHWSGRGGRSVHFDFSAGGGGLFIRSSVPRIALEFRAALAANFALSIASSMGGLEQAQGGDYSRIWRTDSTGP